MANLFRLGLIVNPLAGLGGSVALKGSDGQAEQALALGATPQAMNRAKTALTELLAQCGQFEVFTVAGDMGQSVCDALGLNYQLVYQPQTSPSTAVDTEHAARLLGEKGVDILLFAGGDGTARNICAAVGEQTTVLGIPAGVKIHSGVYAISPQAAGKLVAKLIAGELVSLSEAAVMDIDEQAFRDGVVKARRFGEMRIPAQLRYVQSVKMGGRESEELVLADLAAFVVSQMEANIRYVMGSGSTEKRKQALLYNPSNHQVQTLLDKLDYDYLQHCAALTGGADLNIEAVCSDNRHLYVFQRGNINHFHGVLVFDLAKIQSHKSLENTFIRSFNLKLPEINGSVSGISDAYFLVDQNLLIATAAVEQTLNTYDDGDVLGSFILLFSPDGQAISSHLIQSAEGKTLPIKVEGITWLESRSDGEVFLLVTDSDGGHSEVLKILLANSAFIKP